MNSSKTMQEITDYYLTWNCNPPGNPKLAKLVALLGAVESAYSNGTDPWQAAIVQITADMGAPDDNAKQVLMKIFPKQLGDKSTKLNAFNILSYVAEVEDMCKSPHPIQVNNPPNPWQA
ncbi:MAG TPA: hypothetical protein VL633_07600 [Bacteroidota bacterium]|nr:hypothetical protein [Bacteroidota bacterium]